MKVVTVGVDDLPVGEADEAKLMVAARGGALDVVARVRVLLPTVPLPARRARLPPLPDTHRLDLRVLRVVVLRLRLRARLARVGGALALGTEAKVVALFALHRVDAPLDDAHPPAVPRARHQVRDLVHDLEAVVLGEGLDRDVGLDQVRRALPPAARNGAPEVGVLDLPPVDQSDKVVLDAAPAEAVVALEGDAWGGRRGRG